MKKLIFLVFLSGAVLGAPKFSFNGKFAANFNTDTIFDFNSFLIFFGITSLSVKIPGLLTSILSDQSGKKNKKKSSSLLEKIDNYGQYAHSFTGTTLPLFSAIILYKKWNSLNNAQKLFLFANILFNKICEKQVKMVKIPVYYNTNNTNKSHQRY